ncbi:response regulator [Nitrosopumilus ureiphilus]
MRKYPIILIIDDSKVFRSFCHDIIKKSVRLARICEAKDGVEGLKLYVKYRPDLILLDYVMPNLDGSKVLEYIRKNDKDTRVIMISAWKDDQTTINYLMKLGAFSFISKPMNRTILMKVVTDALHQGKITSNSNRISKSVVLSEYYP